MSKPAYSPFEKTIDQLSAEDLAGLRQVTEGWYIEYKRAPVSAAAIAKSIAAFANTYGGWLFLGVTERSKEDPVAEIFNGFDVADLEAVMQRVRQGVAHHVQPTPVFFSKALQGPCDAIGLAEGAVIVAIEVPPGLNAPYIHSDGRVFRRVADSSEPEAERDRYTIDRLRKRSGPTIKFYKRWIEEDPVFTKSESETPYVRILINPDLWFERDLNHKLKLGEFKQTLNQAGATGSLIPFDTVYPSSKGFVARQIRNNDPYNLTLTWRFSGDLVSEILIPLSIYRLDEVSLLAHRLHGYENIERFQKLLENDGHTSVKVVDLSMLFNILTGICEALQRLMKATQCDAPLHFKVRLLNVWRTVPFVDSVTAIKFMEEHGVPLCLDEEATLPIGTDPDTFEVIKQDGDDPNSLWVMLAFRIHALIANGMGVSHELAFGDPDSPYISELMAAGRTASALQQKRIDEKRD